MENNNENKVQLLFAAINPYLEDNIIKNIQTEHKGKDIVEYGEHNIFPNYLYGLYESVSTLKSIINGIADYTCGENISITRSQFAEKVNETDTLEDIVKSMALSYALYGSIPLNVLRNRLGEIAAIYCLDARNVRSDKKNTKFYYSDEWDKKGIGRAITTVYPKFDPEDRTQMSSILYFKADKFDTYPNPIWGGSCIAAECLKHLAEFHLTSLSQGLTSDYIVNFNNGRPTDEQKEEIEEEWNSKYTGWQNGSRQILSFNPDMQHRVTIEALPQTNFLDRYQSLYQTSIKDIYTAFRAHPVIFGLPTEASYFSDQDFPEAYKLFNKTVILPIQKIIKRIFENILGEKDVITIEPFHIDWSDDEKIEIVK